MGLPQRPLPTARQPQPLCTSGGARPAGGGSGDPVGQCGGPLAAAPAGTPAAAPLPAPAADCLIKGNISSAGKVYHVPGSRSYEQTVIDESRGERWFCSEEEAVAAGWRPPG